MAELQLDENGMFIGDFTNRAGGFGTDLNTPLSQEDNNLADILTHGVNINNQPPQIEPVEQPAAQIVTGSEQTTTASPSATNFYKIGGSYYNADTNEKVLNTDDLATLANAGGVEIAAPESVESFNPDLPSATLVKDGNRVAVNIGSQRAGDLFNQGYTLEGEALKIEDDGVSDSGDVGDITDTDLQDLLDSNVTLREEYLAAIKSTGQKSAAELAAEESLLGVQGQLSEAQTRNLEATEGLEGQGRGIVTGIIRGQQAKLTRQQQFALQDLRNEEKNLLTRLGLEKEAREIANKATLAGAEAGLGFISDDIEFRMKMDDALEKQRIANLAAIKDLSKESNDRLNDIIKNTGFKMFSELDESTQNQIAELAGNAGIPLETVIGALEYNSNKNTNDIIKQQADINRTNQLAAGGGGEGGDDDKDIAKFRAAAAGLIPKLDKGDITWSAAFDALKVQFPQASNDTINGALGGGIPYNTETGEFDTAGAFGRAISNE